MSFGLMMTADYRDCFECGKTKLYGELAAGSQVCRNCIEDEAWEPVRGGEGFYEVSNFGRVGSIKQGRSQHRSRVFTPKLHAKNRYLKFSMRVGGKLTTKKIHEAVAESFIGPRPKGMHVNHKNCIKTDNRARNLEYVTPKENIHHAIANGIDTVGENNGRAILTEDDVRNIRNSSLSARELAEMFGVAQITIWQVKSYKNWKHIE